MRDSYMKRAAALLAMFVLVAAGLLSVGSPALAAGPCTTDSICFYDTSSSNAFLDHDDADTSPGECLHISETWQGQASYVNNRTDHQYHAYISDNCTGIYGHLWANTAGSLSSPWNNSTASYIRVG